MLEFRCEHCDQKLEAPEPFVGKRVRCPRCKAVVRVPPPLQVTSEASEAELSNEGAGSVSGAVHHPAEGVPAAFPFTDGAPIGAARADDENPPAIGVETRTSVAAPFNLLQPDDFVPGSGGAGAYAAQYTIEMPSESAEAEPGAYEPPVAEVVDAPVRRRTSASSATEVANLLRDLGPAPAGVTSVTTATGPNQPARPIRPRKSRPAGPWTLGILSLLIGASAVALCWIQPVTKFAIPVGSVGLLAALAGVVLTIGREPGGARLPISGAVACSAGIVLALLGATGVIPLASRGSVPRSGSTPAVRIGSGSAPASGAIPADRYVPATSPLIVGDTELRVVSVLILQPAVYTGDWQNLRTLPEPRLQITLELTLHGPTTLKYVPWRMVEKDGDAPALAGADGLPLKLSDLTPFVPVGGLRGPTSLVVGRPVCDVLLFDRPESPPGELKLDLPGGNIGLLGTTLHIRIPAAMIQSGTSPK